MTRRPAKLAQASAFWRLAAKARKAGDSVTAAHYQRIGDSRHREYQRDEEARARRAAR